MKTIYTYICKCGEKVERLVKVKNALCFDCRRKANLNYYHMRKQLTPLVTGLVTENNEQLPKKYYD